MVSINVTKWSKCNFLVQRHINQDILVMLVLDRNCEDRLKAVKSVQIVEEELEGNPVTDCLKELGYNCSVTKAQHKCDGISVNGSLDLIFLKAVSVPC